MRRLGELTPTFSGGALLCALLLASAPSAIAQIVAPTVPAVADTQSQPSGLSEGVVATVNDEMISTWDIVQRMRLLIVTSGMVGVLTANPLRGETTLTGLTVTVALVMIGAITAGRSYFDWRERNLLYELARGRSEVIAAQLRAIAEED